MPAPTRPSPARTVPPATGGGDTYVVRRRVGASTTSAGKKAASSPQCSQAASAWNKLRHGGSPGMAREAIFATLAKCRSANRMGGAPRPAPTPVRKSKGTRLQRLERLDAKADKLYRAREAAGKGTTRRESAYDRSVGLMKALHQEQQKQAARKAKTGAGAKPQPPKGGDPQSARASALDRAVVAKEAGQPISSVVEQGRGKVGKVKLQEKTENKTPTPPLENPLAGNTTTGGNAGAGGQQPVNRKQLIPLERPSRESVDRKVYPRVPLQIVQEMRLRRQQQALRHGASPVAPGRRSAHEWEDLAAQVGAKAMFSQAGRNSLRPVQAQEGASRKAEALAVIARRREQKRKRQEWLDWIRN